MFYMEIYKFIHVTSDRKKIKTPSSPPEFFDDIFLHIKSKEHTQEIVELYRI